MLGFLKGLLGGGAKDLTIDHAAMVQAVEGGVPIVDVRERHEFDNGHIPGAVNLPLSRFSPDDLPAHDGPVILVCQAGGRSLRALRQVRAAGREAVHYAPGTGGWIARGGAIEA